MAARALRTLFGRFYGEMSSYAIGGAVQPALAPFVRDASHAANQLRKNEVHTPPELAQMVVQGVVSEEVAAGEAAKSGYSTDAFHELVRLAGEPPGPQQLLDLWDRGVLSEADVDRGLLQSRLKPEWVDPYKELQRTLLSAAELAEMVVQGIVPQATARTRARQVSIEPEDFDLMVRLAGNPPGPMETLELWNRGHIDEAEVDRALLQSRLKPEWLDTLKELRTRPASVAAAVNAVIKERIPHERGVAIARENGIDQETFDMLVDEGGRPISITQGLQLLRRNLIDKTRFREIVARSDVKTEFTDDLLGLQENLPSLAQMRAIIGTGALADADARATLNKLGYSAAVVEGIIAAGHGEKLAGAKQLTQSAVLESYTSQQLDKTTATQMLGGLGYDVNDATILLAHADYARKRTYRNAVISIVRQRFLQHDIDAVKATELLDSIGMPAAERDQYIDLWTFDIEANPHLLTLAQLNLAVKARILDAEQYRSYLPRLGYVEPEVSILVQLYASG